MVTTTARKKTVSVLRSSSLCDQDCWYIDPVG